MDRNSRVNNHVSLVGSPLNPGGKALFVNREGQHARDYDRAYKSFLRRASNLPGGFQNPANVVQAAVDEIASRVTYSKEKVDELTAKIAKERGENANGMRNMGLASATLLERAADEGYLNATVNYQRALQVDDNGVTYEGHAWARVEDENGRRSDRHLFDELPSLWRRQQHIEHCWRSVARRVLQHCQQHGIKQALGTNCRTPRLSTYNTRLEPIHVEKSTPFELSSLWTH